MSLETQPSPGTETKYVIPRGIVDTMGLPYEDRILMPSTLPIQDLQLQRVEFPTDSTGRRAKMDKAREGFVFFSQCVVVLQGRTLEKLRTLILTLPIDTQIGRTHRTSLVTSSDPELSPLQCLNRKVQLYPELCLTESHFVGYAQSHATSRSGDYHDKIPYLFRVSLARANTGAFPASTTNGEAKFVPYTDALEIVNRRPMDLSILRAAPKLLGDRYPSLDLPTTVEN